MEGKFVKEIRSRKWFNFSQGMSRQSSAYDWLAGILACPVCTSAVAHHGDCYQCAACHRRFPIRHGIPDFRVEPDPYISIDDEIRKIETFSAPGRSFAETVAAYYAITPESPPELHSHYIAAMNAAINRGAGLIAKLQSRFPSAGRRSILDLGCGTGGMSIAATRMYERVVGVDVALRWLVMGSVRLHEAGIDVPFICANAEALPFKSGVFDAVVADAVLEHVRNSEQMRDESLRVLVNGGAYFFTTNNRYSILPEPHVRLLGFGLLPRKLMEPIAKKIRRTPYKTRLHSRRELRRMFAGKGEVMLPTFEAGELDARHERVRRVWEAVRRIPLVRGLLAAVVPQYFVAGQR
jgi:ubiquinone/menaquinone biosynthesis C-methylase UbiE